MKNILKWVGIGIGILVVIVVGIGVYGYIDINSNFRAAEKTAIEPGLIPTGIEETIAFTNISVIPMDSERILEKQTVIIENGRIAQLGSSMEIFPPDKATIIDGTNCFLIPGLSDMHVHLLGSENDLLLYLANGVTTIRDMGDGPPEYLDWRDQIKAGTRTGPNLWVWSPSIREVQEMGDKIATMFPVTGMVNINTPEKAEKLVAKFADQGYDGIKAKFIHSVEINKAIIKAADRHGLPFDGHIPEDLWYGPDKGFPCEDRIACWNEFLSMDLPAVAHIGELIRTLKRTDEGIQQAAQDVADEGTWVTSTVFLFRSITDQIADLEGELAKPEVAFVNPSHFVREEWLSGDNAYSEVDSSLHSEYLAVLEKMLLALYEAGVPLMSGTDTPLPIMIPGFALHEELEVMVDIGLSPYDALKTSTHNPAMYLGELDEFGTIEVGKRADLVLLKANPLVDITNTQLIDGVMVRGRWYTRADLDMMLEEVANANN
ncbi:amidohydrolase family protein [Chloroflexota bacterium]